MRLSSLSAVITAASLVLAVPAPFKREGLARDAATANGAASSGVICPPVDKAGSALTASSSFDDEDGNEFSQCTYPVAGACAFFFADGSFSQGSSQCPKGLAQTGTGGDSTTTTTAAPPPPSTTSTPPATTPATTRTPPATTPVTTSTPPATTPETTSTPLPPATTSSDLAPPVTVSTSVIPSTSTSTFFSTVQPTTIASASTSVSSTPDASVSAPAETTTPAVADLPPATTDVTVTVDAPAPSGVANSGSNADADNAGTDSNGAVRGTGSVLAALAAGVCVLFGVL